MAKKRKTLVKEFDEIIKSGDLGAFQAVFDRCEITATGGYAKGSALHYYGLTEEMIRWLVSKGVLIDITDTYGRTPLHRMAATRSCRVNIYIELGADVNIQDCYGDTPLHFAAGSGFHLENVRLLLEHNADPLVTNREGQTPLVRAFTRASTMDVGTLTELVTLLPAADAKSMEYIRSCITRIGKSFEFYRSELNPDNLPQTEAALQKLYTLFDVEPAARRIVFDGISPIQVNGTTWQKQFSELWDLLVPGRGSAATVQGEVIRICGKVAREILDNGGMNWSREYKKLPQAIPGYCAMGNKLEAADCSELEKLAKGISINSEEEEFQRLEELVVRWVLANPLPIALTDVAYHR